jgi:hypothetical protein
LIFDEKKRQDNKIKQQTVKFWQKRVSIPDIAGELCILLNWHCSGIESEAF